MSNAVDSTTRGSKLLPAGSILALHYGRRSGCGLRLYDGMAERIDLFERIIVMLAIGALGGSIALTIIAMRKLAKRV